MNKRLYRVVMWGLLLPLLIVLGCQREQSGEDRIENDQVHVYATIFPLYDIAKQIGGEHVQVELLTPIGGDSHDYEPSVKEMMAVYDSDLFIYNGAGFETWIEHVVHNLNPDRTKVLDASKGVPTILHFLDEHEHDGELEDHDHHFGNVDPHIWLDPTNVVAIADQIRVKLIEIDPDNKAAFDQNYEKFVQQLMLLDQSYMEALTKATTKEIVVSHSAYQYLSERYGFEQIPILGLSPSSEPSIKTLQKLIETIKDHDLKYVAFDSVVQDKVAQTVLREASAEAVTLYTIENVTKEQFENGVTYLDLMKENLETLKKVLEVHE